MNKHPEIKRRGAEGAEAEGTHNVQRSTFNVQRSTGTGVARHPNLPAGPVLTEIIKWVPVSGDSAG